jgi:hypothetical protein
VRGLRAGLAFPQSIPSREETTHGFCARRMRAAGLRDRRLHAARKVQVELRRHWREVVRQQPPERRERFLDSPEGIVALGAQTCRELLKAIRRQRHSLEANAAGAAMLRGWERDGAMLPGFEFDSKGRLKPVESEERRRPGAVRLKLSRAGVRAGMEHPPGEGWGWTRSRGCRREGGRRRRRWTSRTCSTGWAGGRRRCTRSRSSCSASIIIRIGEMKAKPKGGKW